MSFSGMTFIPSLVKIGQWIKKMNSMEPRTYITFTLFWSRTRRTNPSSTTYYVYIHSENVRLILDLLTYN
jgi:hypothetical protein